MIDIKNLDGYSLSFITGGDVKYKVEEVTERFIIGSYSPLGSSSRFTCVHNRKGININKDIDGIMDLKQKVEAPIISIHIQCPKCRVITRVTWSDTAYKYIECEGCRTIFKAIVRVV